MVKCKCVSDFDKAAVGIQPMEASPCSICIWLYKYKEDSDGVCNEPDNWCKVITEE